MKTKGGERNFIGGAFARWAMAICAALSLGSPIASAADMELRVMTFNVWTADESAAGRQAIVQTVQQANADIVGFQEINNQALQQAASATGYFSYRQSAGDNAILSRYPILDAAAGNHGVLVELAPGREAWIFNVHFVHHPYGPYQLAGIPYVSGQLYDPSVPQNLVNVVNDQVAARGGQVNSVLNAIAATGAAAQGTPVFFTGDFNEPSHLDWTAAAAAAGVHVAEVPWANSQTVAAAGFVDSYRAAHPNEATRPGNTWSPVFHANTLNHGKPEPQDRIDRIYYRGEHITVLNSMLSGPTNGVDAYDLQLPNYPSDHAAVTTTFLLYGVQAPEPSAGAIYWIAMLTIAAARRNRIGGRSGAAPALEKIGLALN